MSQRYIYVVYAEVPCNDDPKHTTTEVMSMWKDEAAAQAEVAKLKQVYQDAWYSAAKVIFELPANTNRID